MKNIISLIALFFTLISYSQKTFDFSVSTIYKVEEGKDLKNSRTEIILTDDSSNVMTVFRNSKKKLVAIIQTKEKVNHYFELINDNDDILSINNFQYQFSIEHKNNECWTKDLEYEVVKLKDSSSNYNTKIVTYKNKKKVGSLCLKNSDSQYNYYNNFKKGYLHHFDSCNKLTIGSNFLVESAVFRNHSQKDYRKVTLIKNEIVNLKIHIDKLRYRSIGYTQGFNRY